MNNLVEATSIISEMEKLMMKLRKCLNVTVDFVIPKQQVFIKDDIVFYYDKAILDIRSRIVKLTKNEKYLINILLNMEGFFATKEILCKQIYGYYDKAAENALNIAVTRLRKKLNKDFQIKTIRNNGYEIVIK